MRGLKNIKLKWHILLMIVAVLALSLEAWINFAQKTGSVLYLVSVSSVSGNSTAKLTLTMPTGQVLSYVLVYDEQNNVWNPVDSASYADGVLTVTATDGLGPIAVVTQSSGSGGQTSPQTGEMTTSVYAACAALMAVAAVAFFIKSRKAA